LAWCFVAIVGCGSIACSSPSSPDTPDGSANCASPVVTLDNTDLTSPQVSFARDILPVFQTSCGIANSTCHGRPGVASQGRPFLGYFDGGTDAAQVEEALVGVASVEDPELDLVKAGDPSQSYLWLKVDDLQCTVADQCAKGHSDYKDCGIPMPYQNPPLPNDTLTAIARWIAQGAKNN
jgi:hypothetical protein